MKKSAKFVELCYLDSILMWQITNEPKQKQKWAIMHKNNKIFMKTRSTKTKEPIVEKSDIKIIFSLIRKNFWHVQTENKLKVDRNNTK